MSVSWRWLGGFTVRIDGPEGSLYVDPRGLDPKKAVPASVVLLTNPRVGHLSPEDVSMVAGPETAILGPADCAGALEGCRTIRAGETVRLGGFDITAGPAGTREKTFFPLSRGWLGYLIGVEGETFYHAGATDVIPPEAGVSPAVAFLPVSGRYVLSAEEAATEADRIGANARVGLFLPGDRFRRIPGFVTGPAGP